MNLKKILRPFKNRIILENVLRGLVFALICAAAFVFVFSLVYHILVLETPWKLTAIIGGAVFALSFAGFFTVKYPSLRKVGRRVDGIGLQERVSTMIEYSRDESVIAGMQRNDALKKLSKVGPKNMKFRFGKSSLIVCASALVLALTICLLPYNIFVFDTDASELEDELAVEVAAIIENLRNKVKESQLDEEMKDNLNEIIDKLEKDLENSDSELERAAKIDQAKKEMNELLEEALTRKKIGESLQKFELTAKLGEAVSRGKTETVSSAMADLEQKLNEDTSLVPELAQNITDALEDSGVDSSDSLYTAFADFAGNLSGLDTEDDAYSEKLAGIFDEAFEKISEALEEQARIEAEMKELNEEMEKAEDEMLGKESEEEEGENPEGEMSEGEMPEGERPDGEMPEGEMPEGEMPEGEMPEGDFQGGEMPEGEGGEGGNTMTEGIYDPLSGSVSYGEVFAAYYAEYLEALENGSVPEDLQEIIDQYFNALN